MSLPADPLARKEYPIYSGFLRYFPAAIAAVAHHSYLGNQRHNPGLPLCHDRSKSDDEPDALMRHLMEGDYVGTAWRAMSLLQKHLEASGAPIAPAAINAPPRAAPLSPAEIAEAQRQALEARGTDELALNAGGEA